MQSCSVASTRGEERCHYATVNDITPYRFEPLILKMEKLVDTITAGDAYKVRGSLQIPDKDGTEIQPASPQTTHRKEPETQRESPETSD